MYFPFQRLFWWQIYPHFLNEIQNPSPALNILEEKKQLFYHNSSYTIASPKTQMHILGALF